MYQPQRIIQTVLARRNYMLLSLQINSKPQTPYLLYLATTCIFEVLEIDMRNYIQQKERFSFQKQYLNVSIHCTL